MVVHFEGGNQSEATGGDSQFTLVAVHLMSCEEVMVRWSSWAWEGK